MRIRRYLEDILGSKVKVMILRELFRHTSKVFTIRELAAAAKNATHTGVRKALVDLSLSNVVKIEHHGQSNLVSLNTKHIAYGELKTLFEEEANRYQQLMRKLAAGIPNGVVACVVFGSFAKGTEKPNSDIDLFLITDDNCKDVQERVMQYVEQTSKKIMDAYGNVIVPHIMALKEFSRKNSPFIQSVLDNHKNLHGEELWNLKQRM